MKFAPANLIQTAFIKPTLLLASLYLAGCSAPSSSVEDNEQQVVVKEYFSAGECVALQNTESGDFIIRSDGSYLANASQLNASAFTLKPTAIGKYLLFTADAKYFGLDEASGHIDDLDAASARTDWSIQSKSANQYLLKLDIADAHLKVDSDGGLSLSKDASKEVTFALAAHTGCAEFPEITVNSFGEPYKGKGVNQPVVGMAESHAHISATSFLGGAHYGKPFHKYGVEHALEDCTEAHGPGGANPIISTVAGGNPLGHDTVGWPTFAEWPTPLNTQTHEGAYYKWLERAWQGGLRLVVNLMVEHEVYCSLVSLDPTAPNCNEMETVREQIQFTTDLQNYIDAQEGGPGKGWFRVVYSPEEAREVINAGKMAIILGIETPHLFDCKLTYGLLPGLPETHGCNEESIASDIDEFYELGIRTVFPAHHFDNAFTGAGIFDLGSAVTANALNFGNRMDTGRFWETYDCPDEDYLFTPGAPMLLSDPTGITALLTDNDFGLLPIYSSDERQCNQRGLTALGQFLVDKLMQKGMIIELDHLELSSKGDVIAAAAEQTPPYSGLVSGHGGHGGLSISQAKTLLSIGGLIYDYKHTGSGYVEKLAETEALYQNVVNDDPYYFAMGFGSDINGTTHMAEAREDVSKPVNYPFTLFSGPDWGPEFDGMPTMTFEQQVSGERIYHTDVDGFAHMGMLPDWVEEVRLEGGQEALSSLYRSAESYLRMWERASSWQQAQ